MFSLQLVDYGILQVELPVMNVWKSVTSSFQAIAFLLARCFFWQGSSDGVVDLCEVIFIECGSITSCGHV